MEGTGTEATNSATTNIWNELENWAKDFKPWQRFALATAIRKGILSEDDINATYSQFLSDLELGAAPNPPLEIPTTISGRPTETTSPLYLKRIDGIQSVNALPETAELTFAPGLTVIYGRNGAGKSSLARILANVCFSRKRSPILSNIYADGTPKPTRAVIHAGDAEHSTTQFVFDTKTEHQALKRIAVFDTAVAHTHLADQGPLGFKPVGFDVFPTMAAVYTALATKLAAEITSRTRNNTFPDSFIAPETEVSKLVSGLGPKTDMAKIRLSATFGETEEARLTEIQRQVTELQTKSPAEAVKQLSEAKTSIETLHARIKEASAALSEEKRDTYRAQIKALEEASKTLATMGADSFKRDFFKAIGSVEWEGFIVAAHQLAAIEDPNYPHDQSHCLLCHRPLDEPAITLVRRLWGFLGSQAKVTAEQAKNTTSNSLSEISDIRLDFFSKETAVFGHLSRLQPALATSVEGYLATLETDRMAIKQALLAGSGSIPVANDPDLDATFTATVTQIDTDAKRLSEQSVETALKSLEAERLTLRHRQVLKQILPEIEKFVADQVWIQNANGPAKRALSPRAITEKETELFGKVIANDYRARLKSECADLECDLPVEFMTRGEKGQTVRTLKMLGSHNPTSILSEGEQRAIALADFLTEVSLNTSNAGIIVDDPVTSQDHQRKKLIAAKLVQVSKERQVIVFTHDMVFLTMIEEAALDHPVGFLTHWVERHDDGSPGQIFLDDSPGTTPQYRDTNKVQKTLAEARAAKGSEREKLIRRGMNELRRTVEEIVPHHLLKKVVNRWGDRIMVTGLKNVVWDETLVADIIASFEALSAIMEGHSHTEEQAGAPPEIADLEKHLATVNELIKRARRGKPSN